ncbi:MAG: Sua5/YciO/YrdC/YwlC family protein [Planctomycetota bacterium]
MPPLVIDVAKAEDVRDVVHRAVQALVEGEIIGLPTETVYGLGASACHGAAIERLAEAKGQGSDAVFALAIKGPEDAEDYAPSLSPLARRLARRCWPGPVTVVLPVDPHEGLVGQLPEATRNLICPDGTIGLRSPANRLVQDVLRMLAGPVALTSVLRSGQPNAVDARGVVDADVPGVSLVLDDGPAHYREASSVLRVDDNRMTLLREGVVSEETLRRMASCSVLMVCTGNTCRSPMAEALMRGALAKRLDCPVDKLEQRGVLVASAGLAAAGGAPPSREGVALMQERGLDLSTHVAQQLSDQMVRHADLVLTMTAGHRSAIVEHWPSAAPRVKLVMPEGRDVADPIGGPMEVYRQCAEQIARGVEHHADALISQLPDLSAPAG